MVLHIRRAVEPYACSLTMMVPFDVRVPPLWTKAVKVSKYSYFFYRPTMWLFCSIIPVVSNPGIMTTLLWTEFPPLPDGGAGWIQTGYSIPGCNRSWNARCTAFRELGAGCLPVQFITPLRRCQGNVVRHYYKPLRDFGQVVLWVPYCVSESRKCWLHSVILTDETAILNMLLAFSGTLQCNTATIPLEWIQGNHFNFNQSLCGWS